MSNKITCTCGHSWNKSSSSKKDMKICHVCGKDSTMKNGGWLDSYDEELQLGGYVYPVNYVPQAENGIEGTMGGLTDQGFNYNGAWGGTMQFGGNLAGAVGSMYARVGAPSNGPYAKKTLASAQDGTDTKKPTVKLSPDELKMERLKQYAQQQSRKEQPKVQSRGSMPDAARKQLYEDAQSAELKNQVLKGADVATDIMQVGNFVPHPIGQAIGEAGNMLGGWVDSYEAYDAYNKGNYGDVAMNAASVALPMVLGAKGYRRDMWNTEPGSVADRIASLGNREGRYIHLTPPNRLKNNPVIKKGVNFNRSLLGALGAETAYDSYQNGGEMKFYQEGLDWKPRNISKQGSKIKKDDNGYWNPDNWGEPVEIGSNKITMQGVYEPLLGISDTGDTQMMYPGEDYKFKGKKVTEYPIKKNGGWLEKYK